MKKTSLKAEEALVSAVEKYPCLYNKAHPGVQREIQTAKCLVEDWKQLGTRKR